MSDNREINIFNLTPASIKKVREFAELIAAHNLWEDMERHLLSRNCPNVMVSIEAVRSIQQLLRHKMAMGELSERVRPIAEMHCGPMPDPQLLARRLIPATLRHQGNLRRCHKPVRKEGEVHRAGKPMAAGGCTDRKDKPAPELPAAQSGYLRTWQMTWCPMRRRASAQTAAFWPDGSMLSTRHIAQAHEQIWGDPVRELAATAEAAADRGAHAGERSCARGALRNVVRSALNLHPGPNRLNTTSRTAGVGSADDLFNTVR